MHKIALAAVASFAIIPATAALFASDVQAQTMPGPFENTAHIVCADQKMAIDLLAVFEVGVDLGEQILAHLATRGVCERATFSGKPVLDVYKHPTDKLREGHVFEVDVTSGDVLKGRTRAYILLNILRDNET